MCLAGGGQWQTERCDYERQSGVGPTGGQRGWTEVLAPTLLTLLTLPTCRCLNHGAESMIKTNSTRTETASKQLG